MYKLLLSLSLFFICTNSFSQYYYQRVSFIHPGQMLSIPGDGLISIEKEKKTVKPANINMYRYAITLLKFDSTMAMTGQKKLDNNGNYFSAMYVALKKVNNDYWLVYIEPAKKSSMGSLKAMKINIDNLELSEPITIIEKETIDLDAPLLGSEEQPDLRIETSPSGKYNLAYFSFADEFFISLMDQNLKPLWAKKDTLQGVSEENIFSTAVDDAGNGYISYLKRSKAYIGVYSLDQQFKKMPIEFDKDHEPKDLLLIASKDHKTIQIAGAYCNDGSRFSSGVFNTSLSIADQKLQPVTKTDFPLTILEQFEREGMAKTKEKKYGIERWFYGHLFEMEDGSIDYITEAKKDMFTPGVQVGGILNIYISKKGITTFARLPKCTINIVGMLYYAETLGNRMLVFYNDNPKNLDRDITLAGELIGRNPILVGAVIDADGEIIRENLGEGQYPLSKMTVINFRNKVKAGN